MVRGSSVPQSNALKIKSPFTLSHMSGDFFLFSDIVENFCGYFVCRSCESHCLIASDISAARQLFILAINLMEQSKTEHSTDRYNRSAKRGRECMPILKSTNAPEQMMAHLLRLFSVGHTISYLIRLKVRANYNGYGLDKNWKFSRTMKDILCWSDNDDVAMKWHGALFLFLDSPPGRSKYYVDLTRIKPRYSPSHTWYRCAQCSDTRNRHGRTYSAVIIQGSA